MNESNISNSKYYKLSRLNNFDLIRLFAALQVAILHTNAHLKINSPGVIWDFFLDCIRPFPGVPIFFTISGFLIFSSYAHSKSIKNYFVNRILRVYPLLFIITIITSICLLFFSNGNINVKEFILWIMGQCTIFQYYTPESLRFFGVGTPNGALWTIAVEVQFYLIIPLIFLFKGKWRGRMMLILALMGFLLYTLVPKLGFPLILNKILGVSVFFYLLHFMIGALLYAHFSKIKKYIENRAMYWILAYILFYLVLNKGLGLYSDLYSPNVFGVIAVVILSLTVLSVANTKVNLSNTLLKGFDLSYGLYVVHMVVVNVMVELGYIQHYRYLIVAIGTSLIFSIISWKFIEKPSLLLKRKI